MSTEPDLHTTRTQHFKLFDDNRSESSLDWKLYPQRKKESTNLAHFEKLVSPFANINLAPHIIDQETNKIKRML